MSLRANEPGHGTPAVTCDFSLLRFRSGRALLVVSADLHNDRRDFRIGCAPWHAKARLRIAAGIPWLDLCRYRFVLVFSRDSHGDLHSDRRTMPPSSQGPFARAGDGLHRMSFRSVWNNSRGLYDCRSFARVGEGFIPHSFYAGTELKIGHWALAIAQLRSETLVVRLNFHRWDYPCFASAAAIARRCLS